MSNFKNLAFSLKAFSPFRTFLIYCLLVVGLSHEVRAQSGAPPAGGVFQEIVFASGISSPTAMAFAPDGRIFVTEQGGTLRVIQNSGQLLPTPFMSIGVDSNGERGLLGVALDPNFSSNNFVYLYYTVPGSPAHNRVSRFTANGNVAIVGSENILLELDNLSTATNHNGGALHFGVDGKLYVAVGDNASGANAQNLSKRLGKILRINSDGTIPSDNPSSFAGISGTTTGPNRAIWALGLRNPFTFAFDPITGQMHINDVGQNAWEEINVGAAGANYGWPSCEGLYVSGSSSADCPNPSFSAPLHAYGHSAGVCAITGGAFYNPTNPQYPADFQGKYFFADFCTDWIKRLDRTTFQVSTFLSTANLALDLQIGPDGNLYYLEYGGSVKKVTYTVSPGTATSTPTATRSASITATRTRTPGISATAIPTPPVSTATSTATRIPTLTRTAISTATIVFTPTVTRTPTLPVVTVTVTPMRTPTRTPTRTSANSSSSSSSSTSSSSSSSTPEPVRGACRNGIDDDGDGLIDFGSDPGCSSRIDRQESDSVGPECDNASDDDGDGNIDMQDSDCTRPTDLLEDDHFFDQNCVVRDLNSIKLEFMSEAKRIDNLCRRVLKKSSGALQEKLTISVNGQLPNIVLICPDGPLCKMQEHTELKASQKKLINGLTRSCRRALESKVKDSGRLKRKNVTLDKTRRNILRNLSSLPEHISDCDREE